MDDLQIYYDMLNAIKKGDTQKVKDMIEEFGLSFSPLWDDGYRLLTTAIQKNKVEIVSYLLGKNAKVHSDRDFLSPLQIAAMKNNTKIFKMLLKHGAKISNDNIYNNKSPIELAVEHDNIEIARLIVKHKNFGLKCDQSLLHMAIKNNNLTMVFLLLDIGADVNEYDEDGFAPIHHAIIENNNDILESLIYYGADINAKNKYGETPVSMYLFHSYKGMYIEWGDSPGMYLHYDPKDTSTLAILLDNDADINYFDIREYLSRDTDDSSGVINADGRVHPASMKDKKRIIKQIVKLRSRNAPLSDNHKNFLSSLIKPKRLDNYTKICELEMSRAMMEKIPNSGISLHDILSKNYNVLAAYAKNKNHETFILSSDISDRYPVYGSVMKLRFSKGLERKILLEISTKIFHIIFPVASDLLSVAVDNVFECLDNFDLRDFLRKF
ncbi:E3 ubiquitin-protein ligase mind-bomb-like [Microplitis mediator]|uniref:E3 ubiquitin-protein ligase mind-bomb-like n=1 Tax=Microplitis mediator TaxID=375433 RepID=UPI002553440F|nr:E3 ubiquitin-protein ligase mind-bomb-like [Microplitis mediator]